MKSRASAAASSDVAGNISQTQYTYVFISISSQSEGIYDAIKISHAPQQQRTYNSW